MFCTALLSLIWGISMGGKTQLLIIPSSHMQKASCPLATPQEPTHMVQHLLSIGFVASSDLGGQASPPSGLSSQVPRLPEGPKSSASACTMHTSNADQMSLMCAFNCQLLVPQGPGCSSCSSGHCGLLQQDPMGKTIVPVPPRWEC